MTKEMWMTIGISVGVTIVLAFVLHDRIAGFIPQL